MYSKYLYSKINETKSEVVFLIPTKEEIRFLEANNIKFRKKEGLYMVNAHQLKCLFCH